MRRVYVDTNVIIARYKPQDPLYSTANEFFTRKDIEFIISPLSLVELNAVISRLLPSNIIVPSNIKKIDVPTLVEFIIYDCNLRLVSKSYLTAYQIRKMKVRIPLEYYLALLIADTIKLRTLDLLHLAYVYLMKDYVSVFVTGDEEIIERKNVIKKFGIRIIHPEEFLDELVPKR